MSGVPPPPPPFPQNFVPPLPPGWTEHRAPAGQPYWFNPSTNVSTYVRPVPAFPPPPLGPGGPHLAPPLHFPAQGPPPTLAPPVKEKKEKPKTKTPVEGTDWTKVVTNKGNTFWTNRVTKESVWTVPDEVREAEKNAGGGKKRKEREGEGVAEDEEGEGEGEELEGGEKVDVEVEGEDSELPTVSDAKEPVVVEEKIIEPKKKKRKNKVVREIEELEQDEDWQRQVASQMAAEVEAEQRAQEEAIAAESKPAEPTPAVVVSTSVPTTPAAASTPVLNDVSREEAAAMFRVMLASKEIQPMAPWDMELPKFINDPRYTAVKLLKDRRDLFDEFCKDKIREIRAAKKAAQEAGGPKADPLTGYRALLLTAVTSTRTHFSDFKKAHSKDPRFREFGKTEGEKEKVFKGWLRELGERKRAEAKKAEERFVEMLKADATIKEGDKWSEVKTRHVSDPRYDAVNSSSLRESLFTQHVASLSSSSSAPAAKLDKATRAAASLKEREEQVRGEKERMGRSAAAARGAAGREEGEREFQSLLIDTVRDHEARWDAVLPFLSADTRFSTSPLSPHDQRRLLDAHLTTLYSKRLAVIESLFLENSPSLASPFTPILDAIASLPAVTRLVGSDERRLKGLWETWKAKREFIARREFDELLRESPVIEHWGRLQKKAKEEGATEVKAEEEEEEDDGVLDIGDMAKQVDIKAVHAVLKHDKRYLVYNHIPEKRNEWIEEYLLHLSAPKLTVHQRD